MIRQPRLLGGVALALAALAPAAVAAQQAPAERVPVSASGAPGETEGSLGEGELVRLPATPARWRQPSPLATNPAATVTSERLLRARAEPENWLTYYGDYEGRRYSALDQIDTTNVSQLTEAWSKTWPIPHKFEATPLVVGGTMYVTTGGHTSIYALDARTGEERWSFQPEVKVAIPVCCGQVNRGAALGDGKVYFVSLDAVLYALDAQTGRVVWQQRLARPEEGYSATVAPLFVKGKVLTGISGGEYGIRGFIDAYDAATGERAWRFYTVPAPGQPGSETWPAESWQTGGGPTWITGTYDPERDLVYWGVGNPGPNLNGDFRNGDNLYTNSVVALDPDDGSLRWHYQYTPHDVWDYDAIQVHTIVDVPIEGRGLVPALLHADKNGHFYVLDRAKGTFLYATKIARTTWLEGLDQQTGRPVVDSSALPAAHYKPICPSAYGASEWTHMSYHPATRMVYVPVIEQCALFRQSQPFYQPGLPFWAGRQVYDAFGPAESHGFLMAIDVPTGEIRWRIRSDKPVIANTMTTAGGLVFWRELTGKFHATNAVTGQDLWTETLGSGSPGSVMTYAIDGRQYVAWTAVAPQSGHHKLIVHTLPASAGAASGR